MEGREGREMGRERGVEISCCCCFRCCCFEGRGRLGGWGMGVGWGVGAGVVHVLLDEMYRCFH